MKNQKKSTVLDNQGFIILLAGSMMLFGIVVVCITVYAFISFANEAKHPRQVVLSPNSAHVNELRNQTVGKLEAEFEKIDQNSSLKFYTSSNYDTCKKGESYWNNPKQYEIKCIYRMTKYYGLIDDFRPNMLSLDSDLRNKSWSGQGIRYTINDYFDGQYLQPTPYIASYSVADMPPSEFNKNEVKLYLAYGERDFKKPTIQQMKDAYTGYLEIFAGSYKRTSGFDPYKLFEQVTKTDKYLVAISMEKTYYIVPTKDFKKQY